MLKQLLRQLFLLLIISLFFGFVIESFGGSFIVGVLFGILVQYVVYNTFVYFLKFYGEIRLKKLEVEKMKEMTYQGIEVMCPCQHKQFAFVRLNRSNYYKCDKCKKTVSIFVATETAIVTEPIADTDISSIDKMLQSKINELT